MIKRICYIMLITFMGAFSQHDQVLELLFENDQQYEELFDELIDILENPYDINSVTKSQLDALPFLTSAQIDDILSYRNRVKRIENMNHLGHICDVELLGHFVKVEKIFRLPSMTITTRNRLVRQLDTSRGYSENIYNGNPNKIYNRILLNSSSVSAGVLFEKDAGEQKLNDATFAYINHSVFNGHINYTIGNFAFENGQGLANWGPYQLNKGYEVIYSARKKPRGIVPYRSSSENSAYRGLAVTAQAKRFKLVMFASRQYYDATLKDGLVSSLSSTGYHRTVTERDKINNLAMFSYGVDVRTEFMSNDFISFYKINHHFSPVVYKNLSDYSSFFNASFLSMHGLTFELNKNQLNFFGEIVGNNEHNTSWISGAWYKLKRVQFVLSGRSYSPNFYSPLAKSFGEKEYANNECGVYFGCKLNVSRKTKIELFYDDFSYPKGNAKSPFSLHGDEWMLFLQQKMPNLIYYTRLKVQQKPQITKIEDSFGNEFYREISYQKKTWRQQIDSQISRKIRMRFRYEQNWYTENKFGLIKDSESTTGYLLYADMNYSFNDFCSVNFRTTSFDAVNFENRLYQYERDVPGVMSVPVLYGRGVRHYCALYIKNGSLRLSAKYGVTIYDDRDEVGSGYDVVPKNFVQRVSLQLDYRFIR